MCLFDLRNQSPEVLQRILDDYYFLGPPWFEETRKGWRVSQLAYLVLDPAYYDQIIPNAKVHDHSRETGKYRHYIPHGEVWMDGHVPLEWIETVILAKILKPQ